MMVHSRQEYSWLMEDEMFESFEDGTSDWTTLKDEIGTALRLLTEEREQAEKVLNGDRTQFDRESLADLREALRLVALYAEGAHGSLTWYMEDHKGDWI